MTSTTTLPPVVAVLALLEPQAGDQTTTRRTHAQITHARATPSHSPTTASQSPTTGTTRSTTATMATEEGADVTATPTGVERARKGGGVPEKSFAKGTGRVSACQSACAETSGLPGGLSGG